MNAYRRAGRPPKGMERPYDPYEGIPVGGPVPVPADGKPHRLLENVDFPVERITIQLDGSGGYVKIGTGGTAWFKLSTSSSPLVLRGLNPCRAKLTYQDDGSTTGNTLEVLGS